VSDLSLGALSMQLKIDMDGLDASVKKAVGGLDKLEQKADQTAKKTEDIGKVMKDALKGEVIVNAGNRIGSTLQQVGGDFAALGRTVTGVSTVMQGLFQGGLLGAGIATFGVAVSNVTQAFAEAEANSRRITEMWAKDLQGRIDQLTVIQTRIAGINREIAGMSAISTAAGVSASTGLSVDTVQQFDALDQAEMRQRRAQERYGMAQRGARGGGELAQQDLKIAAADLAEASAALRKLESELAAQSDRERADSLRRVTEEKNAKTQARKDAMNSALKEARNWLPEGLRTPGELARMAREGDGIEGPGDSIRREAADRAARNAAYRANSAEMLVVDKGLSKRRNYGAPSGDESFAQRTARETEDAFDEWQEELKKLKESTAAAAAGLAGSVAPITTAIVSSLANGDIGGAIASALSNSIEFQAVGKALDTGLVDIVNALTEVLRPAVPVITMAIQAVVGAAKMVGNILEILTTVSGMETVFAMLFEGVKFLAAVLNVGAAATQYGLDALTNNFKQAGIAFLSMFGDAFKTQIDDLRASLVTQGDFGTEMKAAWDAVWTIGFNAEQAAVGLGDAAAAADKVAQSFLNLPAGFKTNQALYNATSATSSPLGGFMPPPTAAQLPAVAAGAASGPSGTGGDVFNFYGPINVYGDGEFRNIVTVSAQQSGMASTGTTGGRQTYRSSPTPHAPNGIQPYTPATP